MRRTSILCACLALWLTIPGASQDAKKDPPKDEPKKDPAPAARVKGLEWLTKNQAKDGSWGKTYTIAVTSFACLAYLAAADEPFDGAHAKALTKGLEFLLSHQKD